MRNMENKLKKNSFAEIEITEMTNLGCGVGRIDRVVTFVKGACTGDKLYVKIIKVTSAYCVARIERILAPSQYRIDSCCPCSARCGGCIYHNISYERELVEKRIYVESAMRRAGLSVHVNNVLSTDKTAGYRNKALYPVGLKDGKMVIGFYAGKTHDIISCEESGCSIQPAIFDRIAVFIKNEAERLNIKPYDEENHCGQLRHIYLRSADSTGEIIACLVMKKPSEQSKVIAEAVMREFPQVVSFFENINSEKTNVVLGEKFIHIAGKDKICDRLGDRSFFISPQSFYQVNHDACELLYRKAAELADVRDDDIVLDLFCGIGTVGMSACPETAELYGVEIVEGAVENARENAVLNNFKKAQYTCLDATDKKALEKHFERIPDSLSLIFLDPPRKGCSPELINLIADKTNARIVYISCNPDTLARDIKLFVEQGYSAGEVYPVDLFPRTGHVECCVLLCREEK